ncbi:hypothetical protein FA95DRAFT_1602336 [Auriscalpium vulgare]|uniref:Uncharacterized protein n=1 Tax=Auriscalpium vulgare TaxID=40419 RepID=A0ACB8S5T5_9AGAM|nr:hypothetical protein FA95DRAFT_1602336 [Auriscalpium vulgare]
MLRSTVASAAYVLAKYSRSWPSAAATTAAAASQTPDQLEWHHFANPVIKLTLDLRKSERDTLESVRLKIVWSMSPGGDAMEIDQNEVVLEDIDLLSYSMPGVSAISQGLPLKAVYKDCVVGIRYQHPKFTPPNTPPAYRRFQINFSTPGAAAEFVNAIRAVCPCKENGAPAQPGMPARAPSALSPAYIPRPSTIQTGILSGPGIVPAPAPPFGLVRAHTLQRQATSVGHPPPKPVRAADASSSSGLSIASSDGPQMQPAMLEDRSSSPRPSVGQSRFSGSAYTQLTRANTYAHEGSAAPTQSEPHCTHPLHGHPAPADTAPSANAFAAPSHSLNRHTTYAGAGAESSQGRHSSSLPASTPDPPSSSAPTSTLMGPPPVPMQASPTPAMNAPTAVSTRQNFIDSLQDSPGLNDLSRTELEGLVGQVIRDPGFVKLLEKLDSMWAVKGFLAQ